MPDHSSAGDGPVDRVGISPERFGALAQAYDRGRPTYPAELIEDVLALCDPARQRIAEVGAGTGKATELLASAGWDLLAIEPSEEMAAIARRRCRHLPQVQVVVSSFEDSAVEPGEFGLVVSAQAWHWVAAPTRTIKAHEALSPSGRLALIWTHPVWDEMTLRGAFAALYASVAPELLRSGPWFPGFDGPHGAEKPTEAEMEGRFGPITTHAYRWTQAYSAAHYLDLLRSFPEHDLLPGPVRTALFDGSVQEIERDGGTVEMQYETRLHHATRLG